MSSSGASPATPPPSRPLLRGMIVAGAIVVLLAVGVLAARSWIGAPEEAHEGTQTGALIGGPFTLVDQDGRTVTDQDFRGRWMLVYFGFTFCPDVCPTSLGRNAQALDALGERGGKVVPVLISVDPERDTPAAMKDYVAAFHPRMVGLTGSREQIVAAAKAYRVYFAKANTGDPENYLVDHSSFTYLIDPDGRFVQFFRHETSAEEMAERLKQRL